MQKYKTRTISIKGKKFGAIIADTTIKRMIGLMFREGIRSNSCMLFIFRTEGFHAIWMHNMLFPIDVAWVDGKERIVDTAEGLKPCNSLFGCREIAPKGKARYILEFNQGTVKREKLKNGSRINLSTTASITNYK